MTWFKQPDQHLAAGGLLEQWLRMDDYNGSVSKTPTHLYRAQWVDYQQARALSEGAMRSGDCDTLEAAQAMVVAETDKNPPRFKNPRKQP